MSENIPELPKTPLQKIVRSIDELCASLGYSATEPEIEDTELVFSIDNSIDERMYQDLAKGLQLALKLDFQIETDVFVVPNEYAGYEVVVKIPETIE